MLLNKIFTLQDFSLSLFNIEKIQLWSICVGANQESSPFEKIKMSDIPFAFRFSVENVFFKRDSRFVSNYTKNFLISKF